MILVTGGTGNIGSELVRLLLASKAKVRVLTRDREKAARRWPELDIAVGDLTRPETLPNAFAGVEQLFLLAGASDLPAISGPAMQAAKRAGVRHVVLNSSGTIVHPGGGKIAGFHLAAEEAVKASGLSWTFLRPGNFSSNALRWAGTIRGKGMVFAPYADTVTAPIDPRDIAAVAHAALTQKGHEGKAYVLNGSELLTPAQQVGIIGKAIGRELQFVAVPEAGARAGMLQGGMDASFADALLELLRESHAKSPEKLSPDVERVTGRAPRSFTAWVADNAGEFR